MSFELTSATAVFIELELRASSAPQIPFSVYFFTFLRKKKEENREIGLKLCFIFFSLATPS